MTRGGAGAAIPASPHNPRLAARGGSRYGTTSEHDADSNANARPVVLDCGPGHDDAPAIPLAAASPELKILGITTVCGSTALRDSATNTLRLVSFAGPDP
ncbi:MAG: nucleoside hydrolase [Bacteroidota bacterium]